MTVSRTVDNATGVEQSRSILDIGLNGASIPFAQIGTALGSHLGKALAGDSLVLQVASSTLLSTLLGNIGAALQGNSGIGDLITPIVGGGGV